MDSSPKHILVTGGAGYIGSHTIVSLLKDNYTPIIVDDFRNSNKDVIQRLKEITGVDVLYFNTDCKNKQALKSIFDQFLISGVIHFAADKAVGESVEKPLKYFDNNIGNLISILELIKEYKVPKLVFSSSCTVYGNPKEIPVDEKAETSYSSPYGFTKKVNEEMIFQFVKGNPFVCATILRYFNPIGAHSSGIIGEEPQGKPSNLLPFITQTAIGIREKLTVFGEDYATPDGTCIRDYIHVVDLAEAHVAALNIQSKEENPICFNVGTGRGTSVLELISSFQKVTGQKLPFIIGKRREGDIPQVFADTTKINRTLNWKSRKTIEDAVASEWKFEQYIREKRSSE